MANRDIHGTASAKRLILHIGLCLSKYRLWTEIRVIVSDARILLGKSLIILIFWPIQHFCVRAVIKSATFASLRFAKRG